jgi:hypothetical protein
MKKKVLVSMPVTSPDLKGGVWVAVVLAKNAKSGRL